MDSMYGGVPGTPFILKARFETIEEMENAFSRGAAYTECFYGEHCIIDTIDKNNPDNGKIFRRGYGGAEYLGQIVGPQAASPKLALTDLTTLQKRLENGELSDGTIIPVDNPRPSEDDNTSSDSGTLSGDGTLDGYELYDGQTKLPTGHFTVDSGLKVFENATAAKQYEGIGYSWISETRTIDNNDYTLSTVGLELPVPFIDFKATSVSPYNNSGIAIENLQPTVDLNKQEYSSKSPFYWPFNITIPQGVRGSEIVEVSHAPIDDDKFKGKDIWKADTVKYIINPNNSLPEFTAEKYQKESNQQYKDNYEIWYAVLKDYSGSLNGQEYYLYLGIYDVLEDINKPAIGQNEATEYGVLTKYYSSSIPKKIAVNTSAFIARVFVPDDEDGFGSIYDPEIIITQLNDKTPDEKSFGSSYYSQYKNGIIAICFPPESGSKEIVNTHLYAYNHNTGQWVYIGSINDSTTFGAVISPLPSDIKPFTWWEQSGEYNTYYNKKDETNSSNSSSTNTEPGV